MNFPEWCAYIDRAILEQTPLIDGHCLADLIGTQEPNALHVCTTQIFLNRELFDKAVT